MRGPAPGDGSSFSLTVLGSDGSYPGPGGACSGYLLRSEGFTTWLDAGPGTMANLQLHIPLASIDAVVVSHSHPDHWSDLEGLYVAMRYFLERRGLPIYAPEGLRDLMRGENRDGTLDWRVIRDGDSAQVGPAKWTWSQTDHPVETLASRVEVGGRALGYSADTGPAWQLSAPGGRPAGTGRGLLDPGGRGGHAALERSSSGRDGGGRGRGAPGHHPLSPPIDRAVAQREAAAAFGGPVDVAEVGETWAI